MICGSTIWLAYKQLREAFEELQLTGRANPPRAMEPAGRWRVRWAWTRCMNSSADMGWWKRPTRYAGPCRRPPSAAREGPQLLPHLRAPRDGGAGGRLCVGPLYAAPIMVGGACQAGAAGALHRGRWTTWRSPCAVCTALHDGGKLFSRVPDEQPIGHGPHAGHRVVSRDTHDALMQMFILAWEGRT
jgi:hypothetical protein